MAVKLNEGEIANEEITVTAYHGYVASTLRLGTYFGGIPRIN